MNRVETIKAISELTGESQKRTKEILEAVQTVVFEAMKAEDEVKLFDGVTFIGKHKDSRIARNPMDGSAVKVDEKTVPAVKFGKAAKDYVAGK